MKVLHITPSTKGYEEVILLANKVNKVKSLKVINKNGKEYMPGGFLINNTPLIKNILNSIPIKDQYNFVKDFKNDPFVKFYLED